MDNKEKKQIVFSLIQPTGIPTLGNYLGALKVWGRMSDEYDCIFGIADMHSITIPDFREKPSALRSNTLKLYALLLAAGLDPDKNILFVQSQVPTHAQLAWILNCYTQFGEAARMTQFKEKSSKHRDNVTVGLFAYPTLMAADILLYNAHFVPVGQDQKQHLEITRDIAQRFNSFYGEVFNIPQPFIGKTGEKIMSLTDPTGKMSKSDDNEKSYISLLDEPNAIVKKIKSAVTDSGSLVAYREGKDGINNLMSIYSACTGKDYNEIEKEFSGKGYGDFKSAVAEVAVQELRPIKESYERYIKDKEYLTQCMENNAQKALIRSQRTLDKVMKKVGFLQNSFQRLYIAMQ
ncbi:MAG TPA: tryptophan--tRNA ligase, partial [Clostridiales bacterium]|nr:tryptophan--tRNA ligase [Clostridiales bacterium]